MLQYICLRNMRITKHIARYKYGPGPHMVKVRTLVKFRPWYSCVNKQEILNFSWILTENSYSLGRNI